jgi:hypothetical protein
VALCTNQQAQQLSIAKAAPLRGRRQGGNEKRPRDEQGWAVVTPKATEEKHILCTAQVLGCIRRLETLSLSSKALSATVVRNKLTCPTSILMHGVVIIKTMTEQKMNLIILRLFVRAVIK